MDSLYQKLKIFYQKIKGFSFQFFTLFTPVLILVFASSYFLPLMIAWPFFCLSLSFSFFSLSMAYFLEDKEKKIVIISRENQQENFEKENRSKEREILLLKKKWEEEENEKHKLLEEISSLQRFHGKELEKKEEIIREMQTKIDEWQVDLERKQRYSSQLENKIRDLSYEIKTLLQLADLEEESKEEEDLSFLNEKEEKFSYQVTKKGETATITHMEAAKELLRKCIDMAQKMTGSQYFGYRSSSLVGTPYTLDLRYLFDRLRGEVGGVVFVFSQKENQLLFVSDFVKDLLGISPEKFIQNFPYLLQGGEENWHEALHRLSIYKESDTRLVIKSKTGEDLLIHCLLGSIPTGLFKGHVIGIFFLLD